MPLTQGRLEPQIALGDNTATATNGVDVLTLTLTANSSFVVFNVVRDTTVGNVTFSFRLVRGATTIQLSANTVLAASGASTFGTGFAGLSGDILVIHVVTGLAASVADLSIHAQRNG